MEAVRRRVVMVRDGEVLVKGLPCRKGESVEAIVLISLTEDAPRGIPAHELLGSELVGLWKDRGDIEDSAAYARSLRETAQRRRPDPSPS
jgi:hypothetical protein